MLGTPCHLHQCFIIKYIKIESLSKTPLPTHDFPETVSYLYVYIHTRGKAEVVTVKCVYVVKAAHDLDQPTPPSHTQMRKLRLGKGRWAIRGKQWVSWGQTRVF